MKKSALKEAASRHKARQKEEVESDIAAGICSFCDKPVSLEDGCLELATLRDGSLFYPRHDIDGGEPVAYLTHCECSPINGYWLALERLSAAGIRRKYGDAGAPRGEALALRAVRVGADAGSGFSGPIEAGHPSL